MKKGSQRSVIKDRRGAVYVEFLAVFMPLLTAFLCLAQAIGMYSAKLIAKHAAYLGVRAAVVVIPDKPQSYGDGKNALNRADGKRYDDIQKAVYLGLSASQSINLALTQVTVGTPGQKANKTQFSPDETVAVYVDAQYHCRLPIGKFAVCGFDGVTIFEEKAEMRLHGADYVYPD